MSTTASSRGLRIVLVGATGALGQEVRAVLGPSSLPIAELVPIATEASIGTEIEFRDDLLQVESGIPSLRGVDLLVLCAPASVSLDLIRQALRAEVACIDCSGALLGSPEVPLVMCDRNPAAELTSAVVTTPTGVAMGWARVLSALAAGIELERVVGTVMLPAAHAGHLGIEALSGETIALLSQSEVPESDVFAVPVAFDCLPGGGGPEPEEGGATSFESRLASELNRLLDPAPALSVASVQVPTFVGEGSTLAIETAAPVSLPDVLAALEKAGGVELWAAGDGAPSTRDTAGRPEVLVGRVRRDPRNERGLLLWLATDGLRIVASEVVALAETRLRLN
jgi:aspartate-semialdehyde dehydrogenase